LTYYVGDHARIRSQKGIFLGDRFGWPRGRQLVRDKGFDVTAVPPMRRTATASAAYRKLEYAINSLPVMNRAACVEAKRDRSGGYRVVANPKDHLDGALNWLTRAQDASLDHGVSRGYSVGWNQYFRRKGWQPSYPETTGYIIPTFFEASGALNRPDLRLRAIRMADWELEVQLPSGAVQGGVIDSTKAPTPAVFNTGQVMLGLTRALKETTDERYLSAGRRAAEYLLTTQADNGDFQRGQSHFARPDCTTYNTRVAWALCEFGVTIAEPRYVRAGERNLAFALSRQLENGWFEHNCLTDAERPLLHTISYATEGLLECGLLLGDDRYLRAARKTAVALAARQRADGGLSGRFDRTWTEQTQWSCLTGDAQIAIVWWKLGVAFGEPDLRARAIRLLHFVMRSQNLTAADAGLAGGIKGSFPFDGEYGRYEILNWATKFFVDAMLLIDLTQGGQST
jgi:hypothetical protein